MLLGSLHVVHVAVGGELLEIGVCFLFFLFSVCYWSIEIPAGVVCTTG